MSLVKDRVLYSRDTCSVPNDDDPTSKKSIVDVILNHISKDLASGGDRVYAREADKEEDDSTSLVKERMLGEVVPFSSRVARALLARGLNKGDVVQLSMHNNTDFFMVTLGVWMAGGTVALLDPVLENRVVSKFVRLIKPKFIFCSSDLVRSVNEAAAESGHGVQEVVFVNSEIIEEGGLSLDEFVQGDGNNDYATPPDAHRDVSGSDLALVICTSGSTGDPKGIKISHRALIHKLTCRSTRREKKTIEEKSVRTVILGTTGMYHPYGFFIHLIRAFCGRTTFVFFCIRRPIPTISLYNAIHKYRPIALCTGCPVGVQLSHDPPPAGLDLGSVMRITPAGAPLCEEIIGKLQSRFPNCVVVNGYGMSEVGAVSGALTYRNVGSLFRGASVKIADPETGKILGPGEVGEILVKTATMMDGYLGQDEFSSSLFTEDGFFRTGDLGFYDDRGLLHFMERMKLMIKYKNNTVYPRELEEIIQVIPGVKDVGVFAYPDKDMIEMITAVVVKKEGSLITEMDILDKVNGQVSWFRQIRGGVHFVDQIPRNSMGKVLRNKLKGLLLHSTG